MKKRNRKTPLTESPNAENRDNVRIRQDRNYSVKARRNMGGLIVKIVFLAIAAAYFLLLIIGRWIFEEDSIFYLGINIFAPKDSANIWLRSLSYLVFLLTLSYLVRLFLKQVARRMTKGNAVVDLICSFIKYIAVIVLIFAVLSVWGVNTTALLAGVGVLSLIVGLGAQPLIEDIIAGLFIVFEHVFEVGDIIVVDNFRGTVKEIGIRTTQIEDAGGNVKVVTNSDIRTLVNMTSQLSLAISEVDIEYGESLERVELVIKDNLKTIRNNIPDIAEGPFYMGVSQLGASGVKLRFTAKCSETMKFQVERDMNRQIKLIFDRNNINIPFAQIVVHQAEPISPPSEVNTQEADEFIEQQHNLTQGMNDDDRE